MTIAERAVGQLTPDVVKVSVRERSEGGPVAPAVENATAAAGRLAAHREILLLIHGFNNDEKEAKDAYESFCSLIAGRLGGRGLEFSAIGFVYWPGDADLGAVDLLDFASYPTDVRDALGSAAVLAPFVSSLRPSSGVLPRITIVAHSLGCRLTLELLKLIQDAASIEVRAIFLMAAALPVELVRAGQELEGAAARAGECTVLFSPGDNVLRLAFPPGQALAYVMGFEQAAYFDAVGLYGEPEGFSPTVRCLRSYFTLVGEHGHYWADDFVAKTILDRLQALRRELTSRFLAERPLRPPREIETRELAARELGS